MEELRAFSLRQPEQPLGRSEYWQGEPEMQNQEE